MNIERAVRGLADCLVDVTIIVGVGAAEAPVFTNISSIEMAAGASEPHLTMLALLAVGAPLMILAPVAVRPLLNKIHVLPEHI